MTKHIEYSLLVVVLTAIAVALVMAGRAISGRDIPDGDQRYEAALAMVDDDEPSEVMYIEDPNRVEFSFTLEPQPLSDMGTISIGGSWNEDPDIIISYDPNGHSIRCEGVSNGEDLIRRLLYASNYRYDPNEYLMSAKIVYDEPNESDFCLCTGNRGIITCAVGGCDGTDCTICMECGLKVKRR